MDGSNATKKCSKSWCKRLIPASAPRKSCEHCRGIDRKTKQASRARKKEAATAAAGSSRPIVGEKRVHDTPHALDERPSQRLKIAKSSNENDQSGIGIDDTQDESDEEQEYTGREAGTDYFCDAEDLFHALRTKFNSHEDITFKGTYPITANLDISAKEQVHMVAREIWKVTGYRFTDHKTYKNYNGHRTRFWCSRDEQHKKKPKRSQKAGAKHRDTPSMKRYPCRSKMSIKYEEKEPGSPCMFIDLEHHFKHDSYVDVAMPSEALKLIEEQVECLTLSAMTAKIRAVYPRVSAAQVYNAYRELSWSH